MPGHPPSPPKAVHEALAALERYQLHLRQLAVGGVDPELYHRVSLEIQEVRRCCHQAPALSAPWVALLIAHAELSQALWRSAQPQGAPTVEERQRLLAHVLDCVRALQGQCMELAAPTGSAPSRGSH
jgi:hypothetical protein